jgi:ribosomal protein S18 acetylase RimI-like enzyme
MYKYRQAQVQDIEHIIDLLLEVSFVTNFIYGTLYSKENIRSKVIDALHTTSGIGSYKNIYLAENISTHPPQIIGFVKFYNSKDNLLDLSILEKSLTTNDLIPLKSLYNLNLENSLYISALIVDQTYRNSGLGVKLIEHVKKVAQESGYDYITLHVWDENQKGIAFYKRNHFIVDKNITLQTDSYFLPHNKKIWLAELSSHCN